MLGMDIGTRMALESRAMEFNFLSGVLDPRITYTRSGVATRINSSGLVTAVSDNVPRFDFDPVTLVCRGLLIEPTRSNLLLWSDRFDDVAWIKTAATASGNASTSPDGSVSGDRLIEDTTTAFHQVSQQVGGLNTGIYTFSVFVKASGRSIVDVRCGFGGNFVNGTFNLSTGTFSVSIGGTATGQIAAMSNTGNGWWRCSVTASSIGAGGICNNVIFINGSAAAYTGDGTSGVILWGAQLESGYLTSYIQTLGTAATRGDEFAQVQGEMFASVYNAAANTTFFEFLTSNTENSFRAIGGIDANTANRIGGFLNFSPQQIASRIVAAGVTTSPANTGTWATGAVGKVAFAFGVGTNQAATAFNGGAPALASPAATPIGINAMKFGNLSGMVALGGYIRRAAYYPRRLSDAELQAITT